MKNSSNTESIRQINNMVARIKSRYPHLYEETGGKYIRKILRNVLEPGSPATASGSTYTVSNNFRETRVIKHKHAGQKAA